jgi:hypothetical protein
MEWVGHVARMGRREVFTGFLKEIGNEVANWIQLAKNRVQ